MSSGSDDGYATPAAALISVAIAFVATAVVARSVAELRLATADFEKLQVEYLLDGAQSAAMLTVATSSRPPPYRWTFSALGSAVDVLAEPEYEKLTPAAFAELPPEAFRSLGVEDVEAARREVSGMRPGASYVWTADLHKAPAWRACAPAFVSIYGRATTLRQLAYGPPEGGEQPAIWRAGEVWRVQTTTGQGWRDERVIRLTGNGQSPAALIGRRFSRVTKGEWKCENVL